MNRPPPRNSLRLGMWPCLIIQIAHLPLPSLSVKVDNQWTIKPYCSYLHCLSSNPFPSLSSPISPLKILAYFSLQMGLTSASLTLPKFVL